MSENAAGRERRMSDLPVPRALRALSDVSDPGERYRTLPDGYRAGQARFIIITGSVMSGLGKGIFSAGLARLLADRGFSTNLIKMDGYYNEDAGTLSPYRHGEVFVLDDGTECDMDIGTYERFLGKSLSRHNYFTNGRLSQRINALERGGQFSGSDVQFFPHVTGELVRFVRESTLAAGADVTLVEIGGTVGDEENRTYISAMSDLAYQEGERNVFFINLVWIIEARHLNEQKSKAAQHGTQLLMQMGIKPQMLVCRAENAVEQGVRQKLADRLRMPVRNVIDLHNQSSVYRVPGHLQEQHVDEICPGVLRSGLRSPGRGRWRRRCAPHRGRCGRRRCPYAFGRRAGAGGRRAAALSGGAHPAAADGADRHRRQVPGPARHLCQHPTTPWSTPAPTGRSGSRWWMCRRT